MSDPPARVPVHCPSCDGSFTTQRKRIGKTVKCKLCEEHVKVLDPDGTAAPPKKTPKKPKSAAATRVDTEEVQTSPPIPKAKKVEQPTPGKKTKKKRARKKAPKKAKAPAQETADGAASDVAPAATSSGPNMQLLAIGGGVAGLMVGVALLMALSGDGSPPPAPETAVAVVDAAPAVDDAPEVRQRPEPDAKPKDPFAKGPPRLPNDPRKALDLIAEYEAAKPDDLRGLIRLYEKALKIVPQRQQRAIEQIDRKIDTYRERLAKGEGEAFDALSKRALAKVAVEDYEGALAIWKEGRATFVAREVLDAIDDERRKIERARKQTQALVEALAVADRDSGSDALEAMGKVLASCPDVSQSPSYTKLAAKAKAVRSAIREGRLGAAQARLKAASDALVTKTEERAGALAERTRIAKKATKRKPVGFSGGAQVINLAESKFTLSIAGGKGEATFRYGQRPKITAQVLERSCRPKHAGDLAELVSFCLKQRLFKSAERALKKLRSVDSATADTLPDLSALRRASQPFRGDLAEFDKKSRLEGVVYDFSNPDAKLMLADFSPDTESTKVETTGRALKVTGTGNCGALVKEFSVDGSEFKVSVAWPNSGATDAFLIVRLDVKGKTGTRLGVYLSRDKNTKLLRADGDEEMNSASDWIRAPSSSGVTLHAQGGTVVLYAGNRSDSYEVVSSSGRAEVRRGGVSVRTSPFSRVGLVLAGIPPERKLVVNLGGKAPPEPPYSVSWPRVEVAGDLKESWKRKSLAAYADILHRELLGEPWDRKGKDPTQAKSGDFDVVFFDGLPSADDALALAGLDFKQRSAYRKAWDMLRIGTVEAAKEAGFLFDEAVRAGGHAGAFYGRGLCRFAKEDYAGAFADLDQAIESDPEFAEALVSRAQLRALFGETKESAADLERALKLAPDLSAAHRHRGMQLLRGSDYERAQTELGVAMGLDPTDTEARRFYYSVKQVAEGPPWEKTHEAETEHFLVATDISKERAKQVGEMLEKGRRVYADVIGTLAEGFEQPGKANCLVFNTDQGFFNYAIYVRMGKHDTRTLGLYSPLYKQLLFFEDKNDTEGLEFKQVLYHEGYHRYVDEVMPGCPVWMNEGMAEVVAAKLTTTNGILEGRLADVEYAIQKGQTPALVDLLRMGPSEFYGPNSHVTYSMAWTVCKFFLDGAPAQGKRAFRALIDKLRVRERPEKALVDAFDGVDISALEADWKRYVTRLRK